MEIKDFIVRQFYQVIQALLSRLFSIVNRVQFESQDHFASEMKAILEDLSGLSMEELESTDLKVLEYLLKMRVENEMRFCLAKILETQANLAGRYESFGSSQRWRDLGSRLGVDDTNVSKDIKLSMDKLVETSKGEWPTQSRDSKKSMA